MRTTATFFALTTLLTLSAQTTALDFTADDCAGMPHNLFSELEEGNAVIIDLVMMGCQPCVTASNGIISNVLPNTTDPARVKFYSIGYTNSITCAQIMDWQETNSFEHPVFAGMSAQTTYYGGMGMPTIMVLGGGSSHTVFYGEQGYSSGDNPALIMAINEALAGSIGMAEQQADVVVLSPNPAHDVLTINGGTWTNVRVLDLQGKELLSGPVVNNRLDVDALRPGTYVVVLNDQSGRQTTQRFEKR